MHAGSPFPMAVIRLPEGEIIWGNDGFYAITGLSDGCRYQTLESVVPGFTTGWLREGRNELPGDQLIGTRRYRIYGNYVRSEDDATTVRLATIFFADMTEMFNVRDEFLRTRPITAVILIDNYDDADEQPAGLDHLQARRADQRGRLRLGHGSACALPQDRAQPVSAAVREQGPCPGLQEGKFSILDAIRAVTNPAGVNATISLGIGKDGSSFEENYSFANLSIEMALSRGGDQAVIKDRYNFTFYGGRTKETERRTRVKSRVVAGSLSELISQSSKVFVMGHKMADLDALGAAVGISCLCRKRGKTAQIVIDLEKNASQSLLAELKASNDFSGVFVSCEDALLEADAKSLLIVVDTNRPDQVESRALLESIPRVAVIDHHRRAADYIEQVVLNLHEPFASSASELVTELLQYAVEQRDIRPIEAQALLAGIVLDTKKFSVRTGSRTFEAAAFLRRVGADTVDVMKLFQNDLDATIIRYQIIQAARLYRNEIAIAAVDHTVPRTIAAQAADELLNISGIMTSFVLYPDGDVVFMSARSIGSCNVQVVLEKLGGGGNAATAGAQIKNKTVREVLAELVASIDQFYES